MAKGKHVNRPFCNKPLGSRFLICPFPLCFYCVGSPKSTLSHREYIWKGLGGPNALVFATDIKTFCLKETEKLKYFLRQKCYLRADLVLFVFISLSSETFAQYCRKWRVCKMNGSVPTNTCRRGN